MTEKLSCPLLLRRAAIKFCKGKLKRGHCCARNSGFSWQNERSYHLHSAWFDSIGLLPDSTFFAARAHAVFGIFILYLLRPCTRHAAVDCRQSYPTSNLIQQSTSINTKWDGGGGSDWVWGLEREGRISVDFYRRPELTAAAFVLFS